MNLVEIHSFRHFATNGDFPRESELVTAWPDGPKYEVCFQKKLNS
jgi:hypothetical protein